MKINRSNYEIFFLDYFEGNLPKEQVESLLSFLKENADLQEEFDRFEIVELKDADNLSFNNKAALKVPDTSLPINENNFDWFCIADIEKDLSVEEEDALKKFLGKNPEKNKDFELYKKTVLLPDNDIIFEKPQILKRFVTSPIIITKQLWSYASAAAVIFIMVGLFFMLPKQKSDIELAIEESHIIETPKNLQEEVKESQIAETDNVKPSLMEEKSSIKNNTTTPLTSENPEILVSPKPLLASNISVEKDISLSYQKQQTNLAASSSSIFGTSYDNNRIISEGDNNSMAYSEDTSSRSLSQFAVNTIQSATNIDVSAGLNRNKMSFWDFAGAGLARISNITGNPLTVQKERDENGKIVEFALGERFSFSKK
ncbi:MAG: hypothetical protein KGZ97_05670 [Bacteroidetes bacterium]|nr:hypothetical protein [Bacteroidota bacterium]